MNGTPLKKPIKILATISILLVIINSFAKSNTSVEIVDVSNGKMLRNGDFSVQIQIKDTPEGFFFKSSGYFKDKPILPSEITLNIQLTRLDGDKSQFTFKPEKEYLVGSPTIPEPHSFDVKVDASYQNKKYQWEYPSYEGRTTLTEEAIKKSNLKIEKAKNQKIKQYNRLTGTISLKRDTTSQIGARFPGIVKKVSVNWGDQVKAGQVLAVIESNESLKNYDITSPINGVILNRNTNVGDVVGSSPLFTVSDLSEVWGELHVFPGDLQKIKLDQLVKVKTLEENFQDDTKISMLLPITDQSSQTVIAIAPLKNSNGKWRPGMIIEGDVLIGEKEVPVAVKTSALQRFRDFTVVFEKIGNTYEVRMLELGDSDNEFVEVKSGLKAGAEYVTDNSFLIKADIEKSGASHDH